MRNKSFTLSILLILAITMLMPLFNNVKAQEEVPYGPWVDAIVFFKEGDYAKAVDMMEKGDMHLYLIDIPDPDLFARVKASPHLTYKFAFGLYVELTFNPAGPIFKNGEFNPFANKRIREAMNYIIDRNYIVEEIYKGLAKPKWVSFISAFPEYGRLADVIKLLEAKYSYDFEKGRTIIFEELTKMGAEYKDGKWYYNGKPIVIKFIIRVEDQRKLIGDYVASQLEKLGFTVERMYKTSREAAPLWLFSDPAEGKWHVYTGGWITTTVTRDDSDHFGFFYTPLGLPVPLWQAYKPDPVFYEVAAKLWRGEWKTWEERMELMRKAIELALEDSVRIWIADQISPFVIRKDIEVAADLSGGFNNPIWARTIRFRDKIGGEIKAGNREVLVDPWNPVAGTNWIYDVVVLMCVNDYDFIYNPYTGLPMPNRVVNVTIEVEKGVITRATSPWLTLKFVDKVEVPTDAWFGWDTKEKRIVYAPPGTYAKAKVVVNYGDIIGKVKYHDGSVMSLADWFALWPLTFERVDPESPLYDEAAIPGFREWRKSFRGMRIISEHPLVVEYYINYTNIEAEFMAAWAAEWPNTPWHMRAIGILAEEKGLLAFSASKADKLKVEWMNYIGGPSLPILEKVLDEALETAYIPFKEHASKYITPEEARERYSKLREWYRKYGHFWVASGPFYLEMADFVAHQAVVRAFREYTFKADRWAWLAEPPIPESEVEVPESVVPGLETTFTVRLSYRGTPYPSEKVEFVKYLILDAEGNVLLSGEAEATAPGEWVIKISGTDTAKLVPGTYRLMTISLSRDVAMPDIKEIPFIVIPQISYFQTLVAELESTMGARISAIETSVTEIQERLTGIESAIRSLQSMSSASIALGVIALIIAIYAIVAARKASKPASS